MSTYFVGIGGQRCGTSWLSLYLSRHPQIYGNPVKEMHVFDSRFLPRALVKARRRAEQKVALLEARMSSPEFASEPLGVHHHVAGARDAYHEIAQIVTASTPQECVIRYRRYFESRVRDERTFGEITPAYALLPREGFALILEAYPAARLVMLMRDPVDRFWSAVRQAAERRTTTGAAEMLGRCLEDESFVGRSDYRRPLEALDDVAPADQVLSVFYEDLFTPSAADTQNPALQSITDHLGVDYQPPNWSDRVGASPVETLPREAALRAVEKFRDVYEYVEHRFGRLPTRWRERLSLVND